MKKIYYWGPFIDNNIATVKAIYNSAFGINKYSKNFEAIILNNVGEWDFLINKKNNLIFKNIGNNILRFLPKYGFIRSRLSYIIIFFYSFLKLKKIIEKSKPDFLIVHLIVSLPLILFSIFRFKTKLILRISGKPNFNFFRLIIWKLCSKNIYKIFCPTEATKEYLIKNKIFDEKKLFLIKDPVFYLKEIKKENLEKITDEDFEEGNIILVGRITKQKNFSLIIDAINLDPKLYEGFKVFIFGEGELRSDLEKRIKFNNLEKKIYLKGYIRNIHKYLKKSKIFILTSLWEDPGFVLVEAGLSNLSVISSNCPNGPKEILKNGNAGYLFENNDPKSLNLNLKKFLEEDDKKIHQKKVLLKRNIRDYSLFNHYSSFEKNL